MKRYLIFICLFAMIIIPSKLIATTEYARQTGLGCAYCHVDAMGGGELTEEGKKFLEERKLKGLYRPMTKTQRVVRFIIGYIHLIVAIAWFGTILYVHILLKPAYAAKGLPRGELLLGWISIILLAITGTLLSFARIPSWQALFSTRFGILLSIKIALFLLMVISAFIVTFFIGPQLRRKLLQPVKKKEEFTLEELQYFDGKEGRPAYIAYRGKVYDLSGSRLWKDGSHARKHLAGNDLTDALKTAPHGEEHVLRMPVVGRIVETRIAMPAPVRIFYFFAYMNLVLVFLITFIIALWRWGN
ncbi:MAG: CopD family protein [Thermodesulfovibrionales bacterium]|nr:CopD family protein [Thermodesulfovibrionales bacterium]